MFGYVTANKPELKMREFARYKGFYCGLCQSLRQNHGRRGQLTLTYDMAFLITNEISEYAADMNVLLAYGHMEDDWLDDRKLSGYVGMKLLAGKKKKIEKSYPRQAQVIKCSLLRLAEMEKERCLDIDSVARPFGELMAELFVWREDAFQNILRQFGFYLGKFIYIMDAVMDVKQDEEKGRYNPFSGQSGTEEFEERVHYMLDGTLRMAIAEFEKLPCEQDIEILRNILYEGVWLKSERKQKNDE